MFQTTNQLEMSAPKQLSTQDLLSRPTRWFKQILQIKVVPKNRMKRVTKKNIRKPEGDAAATISWFTGRLTRVYRRKDQTSRMGQHQTNSHLALGGHLTLGVWAFAQENGCKTPGNHHHPLSIIQQFFGFNFVYYYIIRLPMISLRDPVKFLLIPIVDGDINTTGGPRHLLTQVVSIAITAPDGQRFIPSPIPQVSLAPTHLAGALGSTSE